MTDGDKRGTERATRGRRIEVNDGRTTRKHRQLFAFRPPPASKASTTFTSALAVSRRITKSITDTS